MFENSAARRRYLVTGILDHSSIAWHVARRLVNSDAEVVATSFGRTARLTRRSVAKLGIDEVYELDATKPEDFSQLAQALRTEGKTLDGILHSIAAAAPGTLGGGFLTSDPTEVEASYRISVVSFQQLVGAMLPLLSQAPHGGSIVALTVDSARVLRGYDWMGVHKAALDSAARYAALYAGEHKVRVNLVASGPLETFSSVGVPTFGDIVGAHRRWAPLGWDPSDHEAVAEAVNFFLSPAARGITGEVLHVDGGFHMTTPL